MNWTYVVLKPILFNHVWSERRVEGVRWERELDEVKPSYDASQPRGVVIS